jgi:hypothetical protein
MEGRRMERVSCVSPGDQTSVVQPHTQQTFEIHPETPDPPISSGSAGSSPGANPGSGEEIKVWHPASHVINVNP